MLIALGTVGGFIRIVPNSQQASEESGIVGQSHFLCLDRSSSNCQVLRDVVAFRSCAVAVLDVESVLDSNFVGRAFRRVICEGLERPMAHRRGRDIQVESHPSSASSWIVGSVQASALTSSTQTSLLPVSIASVCCCPGVPTLTEAI